MRKRGLRSQLSLLILSITALALSLLSPLSLPQATAKPALVTCVNLATQKERVSRTGECRPGREAQANWHKNSSDSAIATGPNLKVITTCSDSDRSSTTYQIIRKRCARNQTTTNFSRSGALPARPMIAEAVSYGHDSAALKLTTDPAGSLDAPIAFYTINSSKGTVQKIYSWKDLSLAISGLQGQSTYTFTVTATSVDGTSEVSLASLPVTTRAFVPSTSASSSSSVSAPTFTLSINAETTTVSTTISGYAITSTGSPSYSISPSPPAGTTFSSTTGLLSGTPTSIQNPTQYTITASNEAGSATRIFTLTVTRMATKLVLSRSSIGTVSGFAFTTQPQITIQDADNNTVTTSSQTVTASISAGGALVGTKTAVASSGVATFNNLGIRGWGSTTYTITYSVGGLTSATQSVTTSSSYLIGSTGPGGGVIFYRNASGWTCGPTLNEKCYYLEVAPPALGLADWDTDTVNSVSRSWGQAPFQTTAVPDFGDRTSAQGIGYGYRNTLLIINQGNSDSTSSAAALAQSFSGGGVSDWFLPSRNELNELCKWQTNSDCGQTVTNQNSAVGATGFVRGPYWSSSELNNTEAYSRENRQGGNQGGGAKSSTALVRPIRAF